MEKSVDAGKGVGSSLIEKSVEGAPNGSKRVDILDACEKRDIEALVRLAESEGGFLEDDLRQRAWPTLLGVLNGDESAPSQEESGSWKELDRHRDEDQVQLDVNRAFIYYPNDQTESQLARRKIELSDLITDVLRQQPYLHYFQGYHDIAQVLLLVLPPRLRARSLARLSALRIRDFMLPTLEPTVAQLRLIPDILAAADPSLRQHVAGIEPFYALAGTLTMYAHEVQSYGDIARLFDALLAREPVFSVYLFAQIVLSRRDELLEHAAEDGDPAMLQFLLSKMPQDMDVERLVADTVTLFRRFPPENLRAWRRISTSSCLKTARSTQASAGQSIEDGKECFRKQLAELQAAERNRKIAGALWAYRKSAGALGMAVAIGLVAIYLRRNPGPVALLATLWSK